MAGEQKNKNPKVVVSKNGPYLVSGSLPLEKEIIVSDEEGNSVQWKKGEKFPRKEDYALCRCGGSKNKPYCDKTHQEIGFDGTEKASKKNYLEKAGKLNGPDLNLTDLPELCARVRFCHNKKGDAWQLTENSDDPEAKKEAIQQSCKCASGRLVAWDKKTNKPIEPKFEKSASLTEDPGTRTSGPIWLKGGVEVEGSDGEKYEERNRVTLCRCGKSRNKPFCDSSHIEAGFSDGDKSLEK